MTKNKTRSCPYIPNANAAVKSEMLKRIGVDSVEELYRFIPRELRLEGEMGLPRPIPAEWELKRHMDSLLGENRTCEEYSSFLGGGCYHRYVPALCDEISGWAEFLTAYTGDTYIDHGKGQAFFEYSSLMAELLDMDVVAFPTYDGGQAVCTAIMTAVRITGRRQVLLSGATSPELRSQIRLYCEGTEQIALKIDERGQTDLEDLKEKLGEDTACLFLQNPNFLGILEEDAAWMGELVHQAGGQFVVMTEAAALGVLEAPANYGADIVCCELQSLGLPMSYGSSLGGTIAVRDDPAYIMNLPTHLFALVEDGEGRFGFVKGLLDRTSYNSREKAVEFLGTNVGLWAITTAVYLASMGPEGMRELGEGILSNCAYLREKLAELPGVEILYPDSAAFQEFPVRFHAAGLTVAEINRQLLEQKIFGGHDLSKAFPQLGQTALYCVSETTTAQDIDRLIRCLGQILSGKE